MWLPVISDTNRALLTIHRSPNLSRKIVSSIRAAQRAAYVLTVAGIPADAVFEAQLGEGFRRWKVQPSIIEDLKKKAKSLGIWNIFLPKNHYKDGAGYSNLEYGLMAEQLGKSVIASEVCF